MMESCHLAPAHCFVRIIILVVRISTYGHEYAINLQVLSQLFDSIVKRELFRSTQPTKNYLHNY